MDRADIVKELRAIADKVERGDTDTYQHFARIGHFTDVVVGDAVNDARYNGETLILSTLPLGPAIVSRIEELYKSDPIIMG